MNEEMAKDARQMANLKKLLYRITNAGSVVMLTFGGFMASPDIFTRTATPWEYAGRRAAVGRRF